MGVKKRNIFISALIKIHTNGMLDTNVVVPTIFLCNYAFV